MLDLYCRNRAAPDQCSTLRNDTIDFLCRWDGQRCAFRATFCPPDARTAVTALAECGASDADPCPAPCRAAQARLMALSYWRSGLDTYTDADEYRRMPRLEGGAAQAVADLLYCQAELELNVRAQCFLLVTPEDVNVAIASYKLEPSSSSAIRPTLLLLVAVLGSLL
jgi:hypothetical protein